MRFYAMLGFVAAYVRAPAAEGVFDWRGEGGRDASAAALAPGFWVR